MRGLASGKNVTTFTVASNEFLGGGKEKAEYHSIVTWDRLAEIAGRYLGKGQQVAIEGRLQTRSWDDERGARQGQSCPTLITVAWGTVEKCRHQWTPRTSGHDHLGGYTWCSRRVSWA